MAIDYQEDQAQFNQGLSYAQHYGTLSRAIDKAKFERRFDEYFGLIEVTHDVLVCLSRKEKRELLERLREECIPKVQSILIALKNGQYSVNRSALEPIRKWELALRDFAQEKGLNMPEADPRYSGGKR